MTSLNKAEWKECGGGGVIAKAWTGRLGGRVISTWALTSADLQEHKWAMSSRHKKLQCSISIMCLATYNSLCTSTLKFVWRGHYTVNKHLLGAQNKPGVELDSEKGTSVNTINKHKRNFQFPFFQFPGPSYFQTPFIFLLTTVTQTLLMSSLILFSIICTTSYVMCINVLSTFHIGLLSLSF